MKSYSQLTQAYLGSSGLGQVWINDQTGTPRLRHVTATEYKRLRGANRIVRTGFLPWSG